MFAIVFSAPLNFGLIALSGLLSKARRKECTFSFILILNSLIFCPQAWADGETMPTGVTSPSTKPSPGQRNKLEEIFVWKVSDELKLTVQEEKKFSQVIFELSKKKNALNLESQDLISQLAKLSSDDEKAREQLLKQYRNNTVQLQVLNTLEFDQVRKILGSKRMARYLNLKLDLTNRVKSLLSVDRNEIDKNQKEKSDKPLNSVQSKSHLNSK